MLTIESLNNHVGVGAGLVLIVAVLAWIWWSRSGRYGFAIKKRIAFAKAMVIALERYRSRTGQYPIRDEFVRLHGSTFEAFQQWMPELVESAAQLPSTIESNDSGLGQWLYRSNGKDFKLIFHRPEAGEQKVVLRRFKTLADPERASEDSVVAYGYWSLGARSW